MPLLEDIIPAFKTSPTPCILISTDPQDFTIAYVNDAFLDSVDTGGSVITGKGFFVAFPQTNGEEALKRISVIKESFTDVLKLKRSQRVLLQRYDLPDKNPEGFNLRYWNCDCYPIIENDRVQYIAFSMLDVTDQFWALNGHNVASNSSLIAKNFQHPLFNDYPDAVFILDLEGNFLSFNKVVIELAECTKEELLNLSFIPFIAPEDLEMVIDKSKKAINGEIQNFETRIISATGNQRMLSITNLPIISNQQVIGVYLIAKDITQLKEAEKHSHANHKRSIAILESITDGFFAVDKNWTITYRNKESDLVVKNPQDISIGKNLWEQYPEAVSLKFYTEYHKAMAENISVRFEEFLPSGNLWLEVAAYPSEDGLSIYFKDITKRIQMEEELRATKEKYQLLFDMSPFPQWVYDVETFSFLDVNKAAVKQYGYSREEFLSMTIEDIRPVEDVPLLKDVIHNQIRAGLSNSCVSRHKKKSGEIILVDTEGNSIPFGSKNARLVIAIDVTGKFNAEQALKASEQRFKALVQDGSDLISILDAAGNYLYVSPTCKAVLGIEPEFLIGKNSIDFIHEDDKETISKYLVLLGTCKRIKLPVFRFKNANSDYRWIETIVTDMTDDLAVGGVVANSRDVTERIKNELMVKESIERYDILSKATSDVVYDWGFLSNKVTWNKGIKDIFGHKPDGPASHDRWNNLIHPDDAARVINNVQFHIKNKRSRWKDEYRFRCADGTYKIVLDRGYLIYDLEGQPVRMIGAMQNITDRIKYIQAIEEQNKRFHEISYMQSHIVRAPLARIMGLSSLLVDNEDAATQKELLTYLGNSAQELDIIIRDIIQKSERITFN